MFSIAVAQLAEGPAAADQDYAYDDTYGPLYCYGDYDYQAQDKVRML